MTSKTSPKKAGSLSKNPKKTPKNDQRLVFSTQNTQKSQSSEKDNSSSETALFDEEPNRSLEVKMTRKANEDTLMQSSERRSQREFSLESSARLSPRKEPRYKVALVCDWLTTPGGAEKVLLELHRMYPHAPIYTSQYSKKGINWFDDADVRTGWLQIFPRSLRKFLGPLRQLYFSHLDLSEYDLIISVTGAEAKSVRTTPKAKKAKRNNLSSEAAPSDVPPRKGATHLCYCHVPTQYYWQMYDQYIEHPGFGVLNPLVRLALKLLVKPLRQADYQAAQLPDQLVTISNHAKAQIKKYYHRDAIVIAPPVDTAKFAKTLQGPHTSTELSTTFPPQKPKKSTESGELSTASTEKSTSYPQEIHNKRISNPPKSITYPQLIHKLSTSYPQKNQSYPQVIHKKSTEKLKLSTGFPLQQTNPSKNQSTASNTSQDYCIISCRQVTWKRVDLAIAACQLTGSPLKVVGDGPEHRHLVQLAAGAENIEFIPWLDSRELATLLQGATAYLFPSLEPFGIAAVEALAAGCPVIAYREGGSQDFIIEGENGLFFAEQTPESLAQALRDSQAISFDPIAISKSAEKYSPAHFRQQISQVITDVTSTPKITSHPTSTKSQSPRKGSRP